MVQLNTIPIVKGTFPNNEKYFIKATDDITQWNDHTSKFALTQIITVTFEDNSDIFDALLYKKYLDDLGYEKVILEIPFMPYGQMDREMPDKIFTFKYFAKLINEAKFYKVLFCDPHSRVMEAAIERAHIRYGSLDGLSEYKLFYPDAGAASKYSEIYNKPYLYGQKKRNLETGEIIGYQVVAEQEDIKNRKILIRDDICMKGGTFKMAAKALNEMGAAQVDLYISHLMPQSKELFENREQYGIKNIYTLNTLSLDWVPDEMVMPY